MTNIDEDVEKLEFSYTDGGNMNWDSDVDKESESSPNG